jgi:hypothetical protein
VVRRASRSAQAAACQLSVDGETSNSSECQGFSLPCCPWPRADRRLLSLAVAILLRKSREISGNLAGNPNSRVTGVAEWVSGLDHDACRRSCVSVVTPGRQNHERTDIDGNCDNDEYDQA